MKKKMNGLKKALSITAFAIAVGLVAPLYSPATINASETGMQTSAPPIVISPFSIFNPTYVSLDSGVGTLSNNGSGKITITGETSAKQTVNTVGVKVVVQRWTGSDWIDSYTGPSSTKSNSSYIQNNEQKTVTTGYYYRLKTTHWTIKNGVREEGEITSSSVAVN
jgi:hypothetical protein